MKGVSGVTAVIVDEAEDLMGGRVKKKIGNDCQVAQLIEMISLGHRV